METITPPTLIGLSFATGVMAPVLPTLAIMLMMVVISCCDFNFPAIAHLGDLLRSPIMRWSEKELTLMTTQSIS